MRNLAKARADARIGMVFQQFNLFEHLTAIENVVEAPVHVYGMDRREADELGRHLLASVGLSTHADLTCLIICRAVSSSASRLRERWRSRRV